MGWRFSFVSREAFWRCMDGYKGCTNHECHQVWESMLGSHFRRLWVQCWPELHTKVLSQNIHNNSHDDTCHIYSVRVKIGLKAGMKCRKKKYGFVCCHCFRKKKPNRNSESRSGLNLILHQKNPALLTRLPWACRCDFGFLCPNRGPQCI